MPVPKPAPLTGPRARAYPCGMTCRSCLHFLPSQKAAAPRPGLLGYGYCKAAPTPALRARFFHESQGDCWVNPPRYQENRT